MKANTLYIFLLGVFLFVFGCRKNDELLYNSKDNIYLNYRDKDGNLDTTSLTYSFAEHPSLSLDTLWVPVIISGKTYPVDRHFVVTVVDSSTTAVKGLHYEALAPFYIMPADSGTIHIPVVIKNIDPELGSKSVKLTIRLAGSDDFDPNLPVPVRSKSYIYSNRLEKPIWWAWWGQLGEYSRVKHQLFLISSGTTALSNPGLPNAYLQIPRNLYYIDNTRMLLNDAFTWVTRHPEKGYVLTKRDDESGDYDFYNTSSPDKKFYLKYYVQLGKYFFVDENGNQLIIY
ncbi:DUF4843 domain-containing protein [Pararcticibacter amylolyticus]|uniref:DUF4843 domain-containing protein n=1 Tax=Pararcticibacter amylolyticus TaxID=2173175 RepID=A0A2U2PDW4_9SPHI|nr:DUF4843 domain-containing protein [Pararcticibacter amylolyticus]PWG79591.1 hypothetical protein DDR33_16115 [Pararcticibacter amylolyticus]